MGSCRTDLCGSIHLAGWVRAAADRLTIKNATGMTVNVFTPSRVVYPLEPITGRWKIS